MQKIENEEKGITLVELLAAISILSIVILLAGSVHMFGQRQFIDQTKSASQENDMSYAMTVMTTDLRKTRPTQTVEINDTSIKISDGSLYELSSSALKKNSAILVEEVTGSFKTTKNDDGVHIKITSNNSSKTYETTIYFRRLPNEQE